MICALLDLKGRTLRSAAETLNVFFFFNKKKMGVIEP